MPMSPLLRRAWICLLWLAAALPLHAQEAADAAPATPPSPALALAVALLSTVLVLVLVCTPSRKSS